MSDTELVDLFTEVTRGLKCVNFEIVGKRNGKLLDAILERTKFLPPETTLKERMFCIRNGINGRPICPVCGKGFLVFDRKSDSYSFGCCHSCTRRSDGYKRKMVTLYGVESPNAAPSVKARKAERMLEKYGVDNPSKIPEVQDKKVRTSLRLHGVRHWTNMKQARHTYAERTGYSNPSQNPDVKAKKTATCLSSMGCDNPSKSDAVKEKKVETCVRNNGVKFGFMIGRNIVYNSISNLNKRVYAILDSSGFSYEKEFRLYDNGTYRAYDIVFPARNAVLELNGDYWHANPKKFKAGDMINLPHIGKVSAESIWKRDTNKRLLAEGHGYKVFYLWECEMKKMTDNEILNWIYENIIKLPEKS